MLRDNRLLHGYMGAPEIQALNEWLEGPAEVAYQQDYRVALINSDPPVAMLFPPGDDEGK